MCKKDLRNEAEKIGVSTAEISKYLDGEMTTDAFVEHMMVNKQVHKRVRVA